MGGGITAAAARAWPGPKRWWLLLWGTRDTAWPVLKAATSTSPAPHPSPRGGGRQEARSLSPEARLVASTIRQRKTLPEASPLAISLQWTDPILPSQQPPTRTIFPPALSVTPCLAGMAQIERRPGRQEPVQNHRGEAASTSPRRRTPSYFWRVCTAIFGHRSQCSDKQMLSGTHCTRQSNCVRQSFHRVQKRSVPGPSESPSSFEHTCITGPKSTVDIHSGCAHTVCPQECFLVEVTLTRDAADGTAWRG